MTETAGLNEQELSKYCRENGLYVEQIERWREPAIAGTESGSLLTKGQRQVLSLRSCFVKTYTHLVTMMDSMAI